VRVQVTDTGEGIEKETATRVFDPFFTTRAKGTGLGLSISQSIITEHGGFLSLRSVEKKGTTITIDLPVERRQSERRRRDG
jgi:signal transduction histidine kinase